MTRDELSLQKFYPDELKIVGIEETEKQITIEMKSHTKEHKCPLCGASMNNYHGTYIRRAQDLPILGKHVQLRIIAYDYRCNNEECEKKVVAEDYDGFLGRYSRMTDRCETLVKTIALQTSCEGAAAICREMGIKTTGATIIRMLKRMADRAPVKPCSEVIGVDDFAYRKGQSYCTIVCDGDTHKPLAILEGRDGSSLKEWLESNKHVKTVCRDRASAYAKAISEVLPDAMQIADRFHLHNNLLDAVKEALKQELPNGIKIPDEPEVENSTGEAPVEQKNNNFRRRAN